MSSTHAFYPDLPGSNHILLTQLPSSLSYEDRSRIEIESGRTVAFDPSVADPLGLSLNDVHSKAFAAAQKQKQRDHWRLGHTRLKTWSTDLAKTAYKKWCEPVASFGCLCQDHWTKLVEEKGLPQFDDEQSFYRWFHARHNDVSDRLTAEGKPHKKITWAECCELYGYPIEWRDASE